jgi:hypothetical protein
MLFGIFALLLPDRIAAQNVLSAGFYDDANANLSYTLFTARTGMAGTRYMGTDHYYAGSVNRAFLTFYFYGGGVGLYGVRFSGGGAASWCVSEALSGIQINCQAVTFFNATSLHYVLIGEFTNLPAGYYRADFVTANAVCIDGVVIYPPTVAPVTPTPQDVTINPVVAIEIVRPTPEFRVSYTFPSSSQTGVFDYQISAGDVAVFCALMALLLVFFVTVVKGIRT